MQVDVLPAVQRGENASRQVRCGDRDRGNRDDHVQRTLFVPQVRRRRLEHQADPVPGHVFDPVDGGFQRVHVPVSVQLRQTFRVRRVPANIYVTIRWSFSIGSSVCLKL